VGKVGGKQTSLPSGKKENSKKTIKSYVKEKIIPRGTVKPVVET